MATRGTLASAKFAALQASLAGQAEFVLQPCDGLADAIEHLSRTGDATQSIALCDQYTRTLGRFGTETGDMDTLVLGCTHYPFVADHLRTQVGECVHLIDTGLPVARHTRRLLEATSRLAPPAAGQGHVLLLATGDGTALQAAAVRWLGLPAAAVSALR